MAPYDLFALGAAACWAVGSVMSVTPARHLGAFAFTRWRMLMVAVHAVGGGGGHTAAGTVLTGMPGASWPSAA